LEPSPFLAQRPAEELQPSPALQQHGPGSFLSRLLGRKQEPAALRFSPKVYQQYASNVQEL
jgi:hypothetical protein